MRVGREAGARVHVGPIVTSGIFYDRDLANVTRWSGHLGIEMEAGMLYTVAAVKRVEALAIMTVSDILGGTEDERQRIGDEQLRQGVDDMIGMPAGWRRPGSARSQAASRPELAAAATQRRSPNLAAVP